MDILSLGPLNLTLNSVMQSPGMVTSYSLIMLHIDGEDQDIEMLMHFNGKEGTYSFITSVSLRLLGDDIFVGLLGVGGFYRMYSGESLAFVGCGVLVKLRSRRRRRSNQ